MIRDITDEVLKKVRKMFEMRIKIIDQIEMYKEEIKSYASIKPNLDRILGKATFLVKGLKEKQKGNQTLNIEQ